MPNPTNRAGLAARLGLSAVLLLGFAAATLTPASADPPPHAKAWGWRRKQAARWQRDCREDRYGYEDSYSRYDRYRYDDRDARYERQRDREWAREQARRANARRRAEAAYRDRSERNRYGYDRGGYGGGLEDLAGTLLGGGRAGDLGGLLSGRRGSGLGDLLGGLRLK